VPVLGQPERLPGTPSSDPASRGREKRVMSEAFLCIGMAKNILEVTMTQSGKLSVLNNKEGRKEIRELLRPL
jgi:hypothetical protein